MEDRLRTIIVEKLKKEGARKIGLFGSYARGSQTIQSDIDIMVEFSKPISLLTHARIKRELEELTGKHVDLLTRKSISSHIQPYIERDLVSLLP